MPSRMILFKSKTRNRDHDVCLGSRVGHGVRGDQPGACVLGPGRAVGGGCGGSARARGRRRGDVAAGVQAVGLADVAGGGGAAVGGRAGVPAGGVVVADGAALVAAMGDQRDCAADVRPGHRRLGAGGLLQGGEGLAVRLARHLVLLAAVHGVGGGVAGDGAGEDTPSPEVSPRSHPAGCSPPPAHRPRPCACGTAPPVPAARSSPAR